MLTEKDLVGDWVNDEYETILTFTEDGSYRLEYPEERHKIIDGNYRVRENRLTFIDKTPDDPCENIAGTYSVTMGRSALVFSKVADNCKRRAKNLMVRWKRR